MKSFTQISIALAMSVGFASVAVAGDAKAPAPAKDAKKEEPKKDAKDAKAAPPKMEMPKPAPELAEMGKTMSGTFKCTGKGIMDPAKPDQWMDMKMTMTFSKDMGGMW